MASPAALPPADARHGGAAAPSDGDDALHGALAAAEASLLSACALATPSALAARGDTAALLRRADAVGAALSSLQSALSGQQAAGPSGADGGGSSVSRQRTRVEFSSLPHSLVVRVLAALPPDARLRCAEVCRAWRAAVSDRSLWLRVDLSPASGMTHTLTAALLQSVAARAPGHMQALALPFLSTVADEVTDALLAVLEEVLQANSASMRELDTTAALFDQAAYFWRATLDDVLAAAPQLHTFRVNMTAPVGEAARMLRNEAPFGALRVRRVSVRNEAEEEEEEEEGRVDDADVLALCAAMRQHACLEGVWLQGVSLDTPAVLDAFVSASVAQSITRVERCDLSPASAPALARLLGRGALARLDIMGDGVQLLDAPAAALLAAALRANTTLRELKLDDVGFWDVVDVGAALLTALEAHPSLRVLNLINNEAPADVRAALAVGASLGALVAANAPALRELYVSYCSLGDAVLARLADALPRNTHLRALHCEDNAMGNVVASDLFLPAVRANASLRELVASAWWGGEEDGIAPDEVLQAEALVKARADADAAASAAAA
jgi:hypothetical protein